MNDILAENKKRLAIINAPYDPMTGEGSSIPRKHVHIEDSPLPDMWLPLPMLEDPTVQAVIQEGFHSIMRKGFYPVNDYYKNIFWEDFCRIRIKYDFEFFARMCLTIRDKETHRDTPFILNRAQRKYLKSMEELRVSGRPIDIILCKARQWGGSTLTQLYMLWIQICIDNKANSVICGDIENQSRIVSGMIAKSIERMPYWVLKQPFKSTPYQGATSTREIQPIGSRYSIGSMQKPDKIRSEDASLAHLTEVGLWKETKGKKPEDLVQSIFGTILPQANTMKVLESTAKGVGNFFHRTWQSAVKGENNFTPVFIAWFDIDLYTKKIKSPKKFVESMSDDEHRLFHLGATLEAINWYRSKKKEITEEWRLSSEFPSTAAEAFQSTGRRVFKQSYVDKARITCHTPWWTGDIVGENLKNIRFEQDPRGNLQIWYMPDITIHYRNRYIVSVDVGGVSDKSDYSCIVVADRLPMLEGGVPEICAIWHGHIEHDKLAWKAAQIARAYDDALLVIEANTLETESTEGNNFEYILNEIATEYRNLYSRTSEQEIKQGRPRRWGFHTNPSTKPMVINFMVKSLRDGLYIEHSSLTCDEYDLYEIKENGKEMGAVEGNHDDRVMATSILVWVCYNYPPPSEIKTDSRLSKKTRIVSEASI
ncbi:MAG: hypothetical protein E7088_08630 [Bacteroidales bacterium]|nr:hypothetical protein [Bacteroidales bacterium]